jgi:hypothetical protein
MPPTGFERHTTGARPPVVWRANPFQEENSADWQKETVTMPPTGFEPVISALRGQRPKPLDDEGLVTASLDDFFTGERFGQGFRDRMVTGSQELFLETAEAFFRFRIAGLCAGQMRPNLVEVFAKTF